MTRNRTARVSLCLAILAALILVPPIWAADGSIAGKKFHDSNGSGIQDPGEPGKPGWQIDLVDAGHAVVATAITDVNGDYVFDPVVPGDYRILEEQRASWTQTYPTSVFYTLTLQSGENLTGYDFGNDSTCDGQTYYDTCLGGTVDDFVGAEPSSPGASLLVQMGLPAGGANPFFDSACVNQGFGHTFDCWGDTCMVVAATLCLRLSATGSNPSTDAFVLGDYDENGRIWSISLNNLIAFATGGADNTWNGGDIMTVCLDLTNLPPSSGWPTMPTNILAGMQDGDLDLYIGDDTECDWVELSVELCCQDTCYATGDANNDGVGLTVGDLVYLNDFINACGPAPIPLYSCDLNGDCVVNPADLQLYNDYFASGIGVFDPYGGYPVPTCCEPTAERAPDTVAMFGTRFYSEGVACLGIVDGSLCVYTDDGFLGDGPEAVFMAWPLPQDSSDWDLDPPPPAPPRPPWYGMTPIQLWNAIRNWTGPRPAGLPPSMIETGYTGNNGGVDDLEALSLRLLFEPDSTTELSVRGDVSSYSVQAFLGGAEVWSQDAIAADNDWWSLGILEDTPEKAAGSGGGPFGSSVSNLEDAGMVELDVEFPDSAVWSWPAHGATDLLIDRLAVFPGQPIADSVPLSPVIFTASEIDSFYVLRMHYTVEYKDFRVTNLGNAAMGLDSAALAIGDSVMIVANIGPSGEDGILIDLPDYPLCNLAWENPDPTGSLPIGAYLTTDVFGEVDGVPGQPIVHNRAEKVTEDLWEMSADHSPIYATSHTIIIWLEDSVVYETSGHTGPAAISYFPPTDEHDNWSEGTTVYSWDDYEIEVPIGVPILFKADTTWVNGTRVEIIPEDATASVGLLSSIEIRAAEIPWIEILDIFTTCCADQRGNVDGDPNDETNVSDLTYLVAYLFQAGPTLPCDEEGDVDDSEKVNVSDLTYLVAYLFQGGPPPLPC